MKLRPKYKFALSGVVVISVVATFFNFGFFRAEGSSMANIILPKDYVVVRKFNRKARKKSQLLRGDLVIFRNNSDNIEKDALVLKRIAGIPGDSVFILPQSAFAKDSSNKCYKFTSKTIPLLFDKTNFLPICFRPKQIQNIQEIDWLVFQNSINAEPGFNSRIELEEDHYFLIGDNWERSIDSRLYGVVNKKHLYAKVLLIIKPKQHEKVIH